MEPKKAIHDGGVHQTHVKSNMSNQDRWAGMSNNRRGDIDEDPELLAPLQPT